MGPTYWMSQVAKERVHEMQRTADAQRLVERARAERAVQAGQPARPLRYRLRMLLAVLGLAA